MLDHTSTKYLNLLVLASGIQEALTEAIKGLAAEDPERSTDALSTEIEKFLLSASRILDAEYSQEGRST